MQHHILVLNRFCTFDLVRNLFYAFILWNGCRHCGFKKDFFVFFQFSLILFPLQKKEKKNKPVCSVAQLNGCFCFILDLELLQL